MNEVDSFPSWHPAALGESEDRPEEDTRPSLASAEQTGTP